MPNIGFWATAGAGGAGSTYELISTQVLGTAAASVTFSSIDTTSYKHLQVRYTARSTVSGDVASLGMRFNGVTSSSYSWHRLQGAGSGVASYGAGTQSYMLMPATGAATAPTNVFGSVVVDILDYASTTKNKTIRALGGVNASTYNTVELLSGAYLATTAITSLTLVELNASTIGAGSRFSLYGIKG